MIIDAHQHIWDLDRARYDRLGPHLPSINKTITQEDARPELLAAGIDGTVLVQAADNAEDTEYMLATARDHAEVVAVVGYVPLEDPRRVEAELDRLAGDPVLVGIRNLIHDREDPDFLIRPEVVTSLGLLADAGLSYDVVSVLPRHLEHVPVLAERYPSLRLIIDHLSKPPIGSDDHEPWAGLIARAAEHPNVYAKVSGLYPGTDPENWSTSSIRPFVEHALEVFGPSRLMYGGDWPVSVTAGGYQRVWQGLWPIFAGLPAAARDRILSGTAIEVYRIDPARLAALG
ncbi:MAG TPA: amidohydrolase family protein [Microlunatus sp.]|nr:amidohydrolase family protein [Microlunatus sp.]